MRAPHAETVSELDQGADALYLNDKLATLPPHGNRSRNSPAMSFNDLAGRVIGPHAPKKPAPVQLPNGRLIAFGRR